MKIAETNNKIYGAFHIRKTAVRVHRNNTRNVKYPSRGLAFWGMYLGINLLGFFMAFYAQR